MPDIEQFRRPLPPFDQQKKEISAYLWKQTERVDSLAAKPQRSIDTAAVTSQIDLREDA